MIKDLNTKAEEESSNKDIDSTNKRKKRIRMKRSSKKKKTNADPKEEECSDLRNDMPTPFWIMIASIRVAEAVL
ncbi:hypothetical protein Tco_0030611 [Tanacetum coccineum]